MISAVFSACGSSRGGDQSIFTPVRPDPTVTPTANRQVRMAAPTSVVPAKIVTKNFTHDSTRFSIHFPENWQTFERQDGVIFIDPGDQAGYSVFFYDVGQRYSEQELNQYLVTFVAKNFVDEGSNFSTISQEQKPDGSVVARFAANDPNLGPAINEIRVSQLDSIVYVILMSATEQQWEISQQKLQELADSLTPLDTVPAAETEPTEEAPVWVLVGPTSNKFGFLVSSDWEILRQEEDTVAVALLKEEISFEAATFGWTGTETGAEAAEAAALAYLSELSDTHVRVQQLQPAEFPIDTLTGTTIDFLFTTDDGLEMAGSVITAYNDDNIYRIILTAPAEFYEAALQWFNPMLQSFTTLSPNSLNPDNQ